eukprot:INCI16329.1.p1 GENE.INCI16329.1~~INCI16329.1.p1  ORF type:complete len:384 (+),score=55.95 INCI16329.1:220-1371(+)
MKLGDGPRAQRRRSLGATSLAPSRFRGTRPHLGLGHSLHKKTMSGGGLHHRRVLSREILPENILYGQVSTDASHALPAKTWNQLTRFYAAAEDTTRATSPVQQSTPRTQAKTSQAAMLQYRAAALIGNVQSVVQSAPVCSAESESRGDGLGLFRDSITSSKHYRSRSGSADAFAVHPPNTFAQRGRNESTGVVSKRAQDQRDAVRLPDVNLTPRSERSWSGSGIEALGAGGFQAKAAGNAGIENVSDDDDDGSDGSDDDEDVSWLAVERAHTPEYLQRQAFQPILGVSQEKMDETRREKEKEMQQRLYKLRSKIKAASYRLGAHSLYRMFFQADADGDGGVNHEEFIKLCRTFIPNMTSEEEYMFVNLVDDDGSGRWYSSAGQ